MLSLLRTRLDQTIRCWSASTKAMGAGGATDSCSEQVESILAAQGIPLKLTSKVIPLVYTCPIAHRLALQTHHAATIASQLVDLLLQTPDNIEALPGVSIQATIAGLIHFEVGDRAIAVWLDQLLANSLPPLPLLSTSMTEPTRQIMLQSAAIFEAQYAHARCCSLLQLAHHETLIKLERLEESPFDWRFSSPASVPWLTTTAQLSFDHAADRSLLLQLFAALDHLYEPAQKRTPVSLARSAQAVSKAFQVFHRAHPLWDRTEQELALVTASLGLLMATQRVLYLLLADGLRLYPAIEL